MSERSDPSPQRERAAGEIRRVPKPKDHYAPKEDRASSRDAEEQWQQAPRTRIGLLVVMILVVVVGVVSAVVWSIRREQRDGVQERERAAREREWAGEQLVSESFRAAVVDTVRGFQESSTAEERCRHLVGGATLVAQVADYYTRRGVVVPSGFGKLERIEQRFYHGVPMYSVLATEPGSSRGLLYNVIPVRAEMLIEWESSIGLGEIEWDDFLKRRPFLPTQMRVYLTRDGNFSDAFPESTHVAFTVAHKQGENLTGYAVRDSDVARALLPIVGERSRQPVNLRLRFRREGREPIVLIEEFIHNHWVDKKRLDRILAGRS